MMTQENIGKFIAEKRKEKGMTQEQFAEKLGVTNRSISRWENGKTMPDYSMFPIICETLGVEISEILEGKKGQVDIRLIAQLINYEKVSKQKLINRYIIGGIVCFVLLLLHKNFHLLNDYPNTNILMSILGAIGCTCIGAVLYHNNHGKKYTENEIKVFLGVNKDAKMRTVGEMLQYAKKNQKADLKQYEKAFLAIEEKLLPKESVIFSMVADSFIVNESWSDSWKPWHIVMAVTEDSLLVCGESIRGRFMTSYDVERFSRKDVISVEFIERKIVIKFQDQVMKIEGGDLAAVANLLKETLNLK
jgi:transcriptional regulator with XRE-family HTH domain